MLANDHSSSYLNVLLDYLTQNIDIDVKVHNQMLQLFCDQLKFEVQSNVLLEYFSKLLFVFQPNQISINLVETLLNGFHSQQMVCFEQQFEACEKILQKIPAQSGLKKALLATFNKSTVFKVRLSLAYLLSKHYPKDETVNEMLTAFVKDLQSVDFKNIQNAEALKSLNFVLSR